jgi:hypothetical protein
MVNVMFDFIFDWKKDTHYKQNSRHSFDPLDHLIFTIQKNLRAVFTKRGYPQDEVLPQEKYFQLESLFTMQDTKAGVYMPKNQKLDAEYDIIFSGCSQTHADFILPPNAIEGDHNNIWGFNIANYFDKTALNLAVGGYGFYSIVRGVLNQIFKTKNPKAIFLLLPDYARYTVPYSENINPDSTNTIDLILHSYLINTKHISSISKSPHRTEDIIDVTTPLFFNLQSLLILEGYCKMNDIYLKYSSWHAPTSKLLSLLKQNTKDYQNFIEINTGYWKNDDPSTVLFDCHSDIKKRFPTIFDVALDKFHMGVHSHIHVGEEFIKKIKNDNFWN